jgi:5-methylcytosine-specific restriction endonuclease McrA
MNREEYHIYLQSWEWARLRQEVMERAFNECERCEKFSAVHVHHLTYKRVGHEELEDLQAVCEDCHKFLHKLSDYDPKKGYERGPSVEEANAQLVYVNGWWRKRGEF